MKRKRGKYICKDITGRKIYLAPQEDISSVYEEALAFLKNSGLKPRGSLSSSDLENSFAYSGLKPRSVRK